MSLRHGLAQTISSWRRILGAAVAIALGAAFVTATLLAAAMIRTTADALATPMIGNADVIIYPMVADPSQIDLTAIPSAESARIVMGLDVLLTSDTGIRATHASEVLDLADRLLPGGRPPTATNEIALSEPLAAQLAIQVGDTLSADMIVSWIDHPQPANASLTMTLVGVYPLSPNVYAAGPPASLSGEGLAAVAAAAGRTASPAAILVTTDNPAAVEAEAAIAPWVADSMTRAEIADAVLGGYAGNTATITTFTLVFVGIALVVSALVVSTTFQVLVAQRVTVLGLLRTAGATRRQIAQSVLTEALILGIAGGLAGILLGHVIAAILVLIARQVNLPMDWATTLPFAPEALVIPLVVAVAVTLASAFQPAVEASRIRPLAAVRAATTPRPRRTPVAIGAVMMGMGTATTIAVVLLVSSLQAQGMSSDARPALLALGTGVLATIAGVTMITPSLFPRLNHLIGRIGEKLSPSRGRPTVRLARRALVTNRRRAAGTSNALLIGVTLVAMLGTGAASAKASLTAVSAGLLPTDVVVETWQPIAGGGISPDVVDEIRQIPGVTGAAAMRSTYVVLSSASFTAENTLYAVDPAVLATATYDQTLVTALASNSIILNPQWSFPEGSLVTAQSSTWPVGSTGAAPPQQPVLGVPVEVSVSAGNAQQWDAFTTLDVMNRIAPSAPITRIWINAPGADLDLVTREVERIASVADEYGNVVTSVYAPGAERANSNQAISTAVLLASSLLAISIVIALLGVANTLSLSVVERRREFAMLRSVGMTARQIRRSLAIEGLIMAVSASALGILLGIAYGLAGAAVLFPAGASHLVVPVAMIVGILAVACIAGPIAAILPGRLATRGSPIAWINS